MRVTALGPMPVRGLREPVEVFELVGASRCVSASRPPPPRPHPLRGAAARAGVAPAGAGAGGAGHGQVVAVVGEAGVGKSRLIYEFVHSHHTQGWLVLESASVSYGKATPYFPVIDLLKRYCHVEEHDNTRTMRAKVTGQLLTLDEALQVEPMVTHPAPPQTRTCAINASGSSGRASATHVCCPVGVW